MNVPVCFFAETQLQFVWGRATIAARGIIFVLVVGSIFSWYMMVSKALQMRRARKLNQFFEENISQPKGGNAPAPVKGGFARLHIRYDRTSICNRKSRAHVRRRYRPPS